MAAWCPASSGGGGQGGAKNLRPPGNKTKSQRCVQGQRFKDANSIINDNIFIMIIIYCIHHLIICIYLPVSSETSKVKFWPKWPKMHRIKQMMSCVNSHIEAKLHSATPRPNFSHNSKIQHIHTYSHGWKLYHLNSPNQKMIIIHADFAERASRNQFSSSLVAQHASMYNQCLHDCDLLTNNMMALLYHAKGVFAVHTTTAHWFAKTR